MLGDEFSACLQRAQAGDEQGFARLYEDVGPILLRYLRVLTSEAAEDVAADTWLEVVRGLHRFSGDEAGWRAWVFTIARHRHVDRLRSIARRPPESSPEVCLMELDCVGGGLDTVAIAEENLSTEAALCIVSALPPAQAEVVVLRAVVGLSVTEVASVTGRPPGTVRVLAHRGLRRLAQLLSEQDEGQQVTP